GMDLSLESGLGARAGTRHRISLPPRRRPRCHRTRGRLRGAHAASARLALLPGRALRSHGPEARARRGVPWARGKPRRSPGAPLLPLRSRDREVHHAGAGPPARRDRLLLHRGSRGLRVAAGQPAGGGMTHPPEWLLPAASEGARRIDHLFFSLLALTGFVAFAIGVVTLVFCVKYRRGSNADRTDPPAQFKPLEIAWIAIPMAIFVGLFAWGAEVYASLYQPAEGAMKVFVVGKQWMWRIEHANGRREIDELHLPAGEPVRIVIATEDVIHSFYIPAFRVKQDAVPGRYTALTVLPTRVGTYELHCSEYCGTDHARMGGHVIVMPKAEFARWLEEGAPAGSMAARGKETFTRLGCSGCHDPHA